MCVDYADIFRTNVRYQEPYTLLARVVFSQGSDWYIENMWAIIGFAKELNYLIISMLIPTLLNHLEDINLSSRVFIISDLGCHENSSAR